MSESMAPVHGWIGVDLDGTLAEYDGWPSDGSIGLPILPMVAKVKTWLDAGHVVKIFTARVGPQCSAEDLATQQTKIQAWCEIHLGQTLDITATKDFSMIALYDDRCVQVEHNTGVLVTDRLQLLESLCTLWESRGQDTATWKAREAKAFQTCADELLVVLNGTEVPHGGTT